MLVFTVDGAIGGDRFVGAVAAIRLVASCGIAANGPTAEEAASSFALVYRHRHEIDCHVRDEDLID